VLSTLRNSSNSLRHAILVRLKVKVWVKVDMTVAAVSNSIWGKPLSINKTTTAVGVREQWV
jgi:hypothetical protein